MSRVLALKYRPKRFEDLIGQESISQTLSLSLRTGKLSHAYLFSGLRGSGKTSTARIFAKALVCYKAPTDTPCGECPGCLLAEEGRHLDIIEMDAASNRGIDDIKQLIESTKYKPAQAKYKIYIIDEVHMLSTPAFNALLKTLEEPPEYVKFILATTDPIKIPPTILSRTIHFRFKKIPTFEIVEHLKHILIKENIPFEDEALELLARSGSGSLRDTLTLLDQAIVFSKGYVSKESVIDMLGAVNPDVIDSFFKAILSKDRGAVLSLVKSFESYEPDTILTEIAEYLKNVLLNQKRSFPPFAIERFFRIVSSSKELLFSGADGEFVLVLMALKMLEAMNIEDIDSLIQKYERDAQTGASNKVQLSNEPLPKPEKLQKRPVKDKWKLLLEAIYERGYDVGEVFERGIRFISFENGVLRWQSLVEGRDRELLKKNYIYIRELVQKIYGVNTVIDVVKGDMVKTSEPLPPSMPEAKLEPKSEETDTQSEDQLSKQPFQIHKTDGARVVASQKTLDNEALKLGLLKHPLVEKTKEVFNVTDEQIFLQKV